MHVVNLARGMDALTDGSGAPRFRTTLIAGSVPEAEGDMAYYAAERGVDVTYVPEMSREVRPFDDAVALARLVRLFRRERPDVVHTHTAKAGALGRVAAAVARVPTVVHTYHGHVLGGDYFSPPVTAAYRTVERQLARFTDRLVVLTEGQRDELAREHRVAPPERFAVIPLGLDLEPFLEVDRRAARADARRELDLGADEPVVGIVGRLVPIKNHELFLEGLAALRRRGRRTADARGLVVGSGEREGVLRARAEALGLGDAVRWAGWRTDLPRLYAAMDVVALTSKDEGTPVALIEALAAGTPVVARAVGGVPEILEGGRRGALVQRADPEELAEKLGRAILRSGGERGSAAGGAGSPGSPERPETPESPGTSAPPSAPSTPSAPARRAEVAAKHSVEAMVRSMAELYEELHHLDRPGAARQRR